MQRYNRNLRPDLKKPIPFTRLMSYEDFCKGRNTTIKGYLLELLATTDAGLTCREISKHGDIWVQSLTYPLKILVDEGKLDVIGVKRSSVSNRLVQVYGIASQIDLDE